MSRAESFSQGADGDNPHQLGDCKDCGRVAEHRWHTNPGPGTIGDGMVPHKYNPTGTDFEHLSK